MAAHTHDGGPSPEHARGESRTLAVNAGSSSLRFAVFRAGNRIGAARLNLPKRLPGGALADPAAAKRSFPNGGRHNSEPERLPHAPKNEAPK